MDTIQQTDEKFLDSLHSWIASKMPRHAILRRIREFRDAEWNAAIDAAAHIPVKWPDDVYDVAEDSIDDAFAHGIDHKEQEIIKLKRA